MEKDTCLMNTDLISFSCINYQLKTLHQVILMLKYLWNNSTLEICLHRSRNFSWPHSRQGMILSVESKRKTLKMHLGLPRKLTLVTKIEWVGIAMNIMSIGICSFYFPLNTSRFASINLCAIIKLCNTFLFVMSPRKNERVSTIESSVEQAELKILRNVTVSLAITKDQEMLCRCCFATA